ncbi:MAG TPA: DUF6603 domain-containing protein [Streptosporangiaceae bacterium]|nr:DUF6603 domain-containing protein [Streptosporangiaceae bacterium]
MATIDDIVAAVRAAPIGTDGTLTLRASAFPGIDVMQAFFTNVLSEQAFPIRKAARAPGQSEIVVAGQADYLGYTGLGSTLACTVDSGNVVVTLTGTIVSKDPIRLPVVTWVELANVTLTTTIAEPFQLVTFKFSADIVLSGDVAGSVPIEITHAPPSGWEIAIAATAGTSVTVDQLVALIGGHGLASFLPQQLVSILDGFALTDLGMTFDTTAATVSEITAAVTVTNGWPVAPGIELEPGLRVAIGVANPGDENARQFTGVVLGTFDIDGTTVPAYVQADVTSATSSWLVGLDPASPGVTIPSLSGIFTLAGGPGFTDSLPSGLKDLPAIKVSPLLIGFTLGPPAQLQQVRFGAATASPWPVVANFLTVEELSFEFQLVGLSDGQRGIGCTLTCMISFTDSAWLYFAIQKEPASEDWTLSGGLPPGHPLNLTDLVAKLLSSHVTLPAHAPQIVLDTASVTVVPGRSMSLTAGSTTPWTLFGSVVLDSWTLTFGYDSAAAQHFTGSLATTLILAKIPVTITAGLDASGTWSFSGKTKPGAVIAVGDLITDLATRFEVTAIPSDALHGLTISDIEIDFAAGSQPGSPGKFHFACLGVFAIAGGEIDAKVDVVLTSGLSGYTGSFTGLLTVKTGQTTTEQIAITLTGGVLNANWTAAPGHGLALTDLATAFGFTDLPALPGVRFGLRTLGFSYDFGQGTLVLSASTTGGSKAVLVSAVLPRGGQPKRVYAFAVDVPLGVKLADLPLVGDKLPDADQLGIADLGCWVLSDALVQAEVTVLNGHVPASYPKLPGTDVQSPVLLFGQLQLGADQVPLELPIGAAAPAIAAAAAGNAPPADNTKWFAVDRTFGVFSFKRIGISYHSDGGGTLFFLLDASVALGPLTFSTEGLGLGSPLTHFTPAFTLSGLGLAYDAPPLRIQGALYALPAAQLGTGVAYQYDGLAVVQAESFGLAAIGSYAKLADGDPSLFIFAQLRAALGGPPAFFVTGLMAGFGFNRSLTLPAQDEVLGFPLLALGASPGPGQPAPAADPAQVLRILEGTAAPPGGGPARAWIAPKSGEYWLAVGVEFTSFELVDTRALLVAEFGNEFVLALLGLSTLRLPQQAPDAETYAYVELELEAVFKPAEGFFGLTAILSRNSYVLSPSAKLTGGFAFYLWFADNANAGQFVITIGGYHPAFVPPPYFPKVPAVGLNWAVSDLVSIKGSGYFALTTSCVMAGGGLEVVFKSGNLRAWFTAQADLLVSWNPFLFLADIGVSIGVSYTLDIAGISKTLSLSIGASLTMWGPPTGGTVTVNLYIVSFTVDFGAKQGGAAANPLTKPEFAGLLPANPVKATVTGGLTASVDDPRAQGQQIWIVRTGSFTFVTESAIPAATVACGRAPGSAGTPLGTGYAVDVRPMNLRATASTHTVRLQDLDDGTWHDLTAWSPAAHRRPLPASLWGQPLTSADGTFTQAPQQPSADVVTGAQVGATFAIPGPVAGATTGLVDLDDLAYEPVAPPGQPGVTGRSPLDLSVARVPDFLPAPAAASLAQVAQISGTTATAGRNALLGALTAARLALNSDPMVLLAARVNQSFTHSPLVVP